MIFWRNLLAKSSETIVHILKLCEKVLCSTLEQKITCNIWSSN